MQSFKRLFAAVAIMAVAAALGGCLHGHHAKQVTHKPMKLGAADTVIEQVRA
jgi:cytochrome bd-type quinol oxidase subunit 1